jgi:hypothetical protein
MSIWRKANNAVIRGPSGNPFECATCPCGGVCPTDCSDCIVSSMSLVGGSKIVEWFPGYWVKTEWSSVSFSGFDAAGCVYTPSDFPPPILVSFFDGPSSSGPWNPTYTTRDSVSIKCETIGPDAVWSVRLYSDNSILICTKKASACPLGTYSDGSVIT